MERKAAYGFIFLLSVGFCVFFPIATLLTAIGFILHIPVGIWHLPLSLILSLLLMYAGFDRQDKKGFLPFALSYVPVFLVLFFACVFLAGMTYDLSYDGQWYHQEALLHLRNGWNPFLAYLPESGNMQEHLLSADFFINHYPQAPWYVSSTIFSFSGKIEQAKALNFILMLATFGIAFSLCRNLKLKRLPAVAIALFLALNPVAICQLFSFYVDVQIGLFITIFCLLAIRYFIHPSVGLLIILGGCLLYLCNIKFTGLVYAVVLAAGFFVYCGFRNGLIAALRSLRILIPSFLLAVLFIGYPSYIKNTLQHGHPFYPVMGKDQVGDIIADMIKPENLVGKDRFSKLAVATFAKPVYSRRPLNSEFEWPFTSLDTSNLSQYVRQDVEMSGFGLFFPEILLLCGLALAIIILQKNIRMALPKAALWIVGVLLASVFINPECWLARYAPQFWCLPVVLFALLFFIQHPPKSIRILQVLIGLFFLYNSGSLMYINITHQYTSKQSIETEIRSLKQSNRAIQVYFPWNSAKERFQEAGIPTRQVPFEALKDPQYLFGSYAKLAYSKP